MIMDESPAPKGAVDATTIPVGTFFTGRINDISEVYVMVWNKIVVSLSDPSRTWKLQYDGCLYVKDYTPVTPVFKVEKGALTEVPVDIPIEKIDTDVEEYEDCPF